MNVLKKIPLWIIANFHLSCYVIWVSEFFRCYMNWAFVVRRINKQLSLTCHNCLPAKFYARKANLVFARHECRLSLSRVGDRQKRPLHQARVSAAATCCRCKCNSSQLPCSFFANSIEISKHNHWHAAFPLAALVKVMTLKRDGGGWVSHDWERERSTCA